MSKDMEALATSIEVVRGRCDFAESDRQDFRVADIRTILNAAIEVTRLPSRVAVAVDLIIDDLSDRSGLDGAWDSIDADVRSEIRAAWIAAVQSNCGGAQ